MNISIRKIVSLLMFTLLVLLSTSSLNAQSVRIPDIEVQEGATSVDIPVYVTGVDSAVAFQFGIVWPVLKLRLDTHKFSLPLQSRLGPTIFRRSADGEARVIVLPPAGGLDLLPLSEDSAIIVLTFELLSDFKGLADVRFNDDFPFGFSDVFANRIPVTVSDGSIYSDEVTSSQNIAPSSANIKVYPNPAKSTLQLEGLPDDYRQSEVYIMDKLGRRLWSSRLTEPAVLLPEALPNGLYWLVINLEEGTCSKPIVILR